MRVLIIDDDRDTAVFFKTVLELVGFECEVILTAKDALDRLAVGPPDLILLDIRLGGEISGEDLLYQIRSNPRFDKTRVVIITAYPMLAEPITNLADLILVKPVAVDQLNVLMQRMGKIESVSKYHLYRDPVTQLFNEDFFLTRLELALERAKRRPDFHFAVIVIESQLETELQPEVVVSILNEIASRLNKFVRPTDAVARLTGWKFVTLHEDLVEPADIQGILKRLDEKLSSPFETNAGTVPVKFNLVAVGQDPRFQKPSDILDSAQKTLSKAHSPGGEE